MKKPATKKKAVTVKGVNVSNLTTRQQNTMKKHSEHHTKKHIKKMTTLMEKGTSFTEAHKKAQREVGT